MSMKRNALVGNLISVAILEPDPAPAPVPAMSLMEG